jgi:hypothetical protein
MTVESCVNFCNGQNYIYAGVEFAQECCKCPFSPRFFPFPLFYSPHVFACQIVEISFHMAQRMFRFRIAVSHVPAIRARIVAPAIALTFIGVVQPPRLHLKSCQASVRGSPWDAIRTYISFPFWNGRRPDASVAFANSDGTPRVLSVGTAVSGGTSNNSVESCTAACFASGYPLAGVEFSDECCTLIYSLFRGVFL